METEQYSIERRVRMKFVGYAKVSDGVDGNRERAGTFLE